MDIEKVKRIYFVGIGGIGMSAIARFFKHRNAEVFGYDKAVTTLTRQLEKEGMIINYIDDLNAIPESVDLVVYTPAIPKNHKQLNHFLTNDYEVKKRSEVLEIITKDKFTIAVAGSHGKTTVSTMIAHILKSSGYDCTAFLGGIAVNYDSNFIAGEGNIMVIEADEFDRSFHRLQPDIAVVTAIDTDHLDIYGSAENIESAFAEFVSKIKEDGILIAKSNLPILTKLENVRTLTYSLSDATANYFVSDVLVSQGTYNFTVKGDSEFKTQLKMGGKHNVENATAAYVVANQVAVDKAKIANALGSFKGIKRRFEYIIHSADLVFIDDYAHHPNEINVVLESLKELYPGKKITAVFQPHLFSRTKDLHAEFAAALDIADEVILLEIYPAREEPIAGITSAVIYHELKIKNKHLVKKELLPGFLSQQDLEVLVTLGAGDIDQTIEPIKELLSNTSVNER